MEVRTEEGRETELNMTPMIDIVFQLIIFFMLSLKFKTVDRRIESMLPNRGEIQSVQFPDEGPKIRLKMFRRNLRSESDAYTLIRLDDARQFALPHGWKGRRAEGRARRQAYDDVVGSIRQAIDARLAACGGLGRGVRGEIVAAAPTGGAVPHGDAVAVLDAFLQAGITDVDFEGAPRPLSRSERAAHAAR